jgi:hypothetical protein
LKWKGLGLKTPFLFSEHILERLQNGFRMTVQIHPFKKERKYAIGGLGANGFS